MNEESLQWLKEISTTTGISYSGDKTITTDFANEVIDYIHKLQNNWNELKKDLKQDYDYLNQFVMSGYVEFDSEEQMVSAYQDIEKRDLLKNKLDKMQELEQEKDEK